MPSMPQPTLHAFDATTYLACHRCPQPTFHALNAPPTLHALSAPPTLHTLDASRDDAPGRTVVVVEVSRGGGRGSLLRHRRVISVVEQRVLHVGVRYERVDAESVGPRRQRVIHIHRGLVGRSGSRQRCQRAAVVATTNGHHPFGAVFTCCSDAR